MVWSLVQCECVRVGVWVWVQATAAMFDNREYPKSPREFLARAVYPKVFEDCEGLRAQVALHPTL